MNKRKLTLYEKLESLGHTLKRDEHGIDNWVESIGYHNGPGCTKCEETWCEHCSGDGAHITEVCTPDPVLSAPVVTCACGVNHRCLAAKP
jgi:hypothetical protein